jgi:hypothetical protein
MAVLIQKLPVISSNCYETLKNASILIKFGTHVDWTIAIVTTCSVLNFLLPWQRGDISNLPNINIFRWFFPLKLILKCCNFSMDWDRVKGFSELVTHYLMVDLGSFLASHSTKFSWRWGRLPPPSTPPTYRKGHIPHLVTPWCTFRIGGGSEKVVTFFSNIFKTKNSVCGLNTVIFHCLRSQKGGGIEKPSKHVYLK